MHCLFYIFPLPPYDRLQKIRFQGDNLLFAGDKFSSRCGFPFSYIVHERARERGKERTKTRSTRTGNENDESQIMGVNNATRACIVHATVEVAHKWRTIAKSNGYQTTYKVVRARPEHIDATVCVICIYSGQNSSRVIITRRPTQY